MGMWVVIHFSMVCAEHPPHLLRSSGRDSAQSLCTSEESHKPSLCSLLLQCQKIQHIVKSVILLPFISTLVKFGLNKYFPWILFLVKVRFLFSHLPSAGATNPVSSMQSTPSALQLSIEASVPAKHQRHLSSTIYILITFHLCWCKPIPSSALASRSTSIIKSSLRKRKPTMEKR